MEYKDYSEKLDIFLITYNREKSLDNTLKQLLAEDSPVKNYEITILDNNSTDNTASVVQKYQKENKNIYYKKNKYNIGGNANAVNAFLNAKKEYVWILADNDYYNWENWSEVENLIENKTDAIVVATYECPKLDIAQLFLQTTFLPGVIYKTSNIDDTVVGNMEFNIPNLFPHLALVSKLINENKKITVLDKPIVSIGENKDENGKYVFTRGYETSNIHPLQAGMTWLSGYANSLYMIKDPKIRNYIISHNRFCSELTSAKALFKLNRVPNKNVYNYLCVFGVLSSWDKIRFLINLILYFTLYRIIFISRRDLFEDEGNKHIIIFDLRLFYFIRMKIFTITKNVKGVY